MQGAIYLRGNHEQMLLDFLQEPKERWQPYTRNGAIPLWPSL